MLSTLDSPGSGGPPFQHQSSFDSATAGVLLGNLQDQFIRARGESPQKPDRTPASACSKDLDGLAVHAARRLGSRTSGILEIPGLAIEVQDRTGCRGPSVRVHPVQCEDLSLGMRLDPYRDAFGARIVGEGRAGLVQRPGPKGIVGPAGYADRQEQRRDSHLDYSPVFPRGLGFAAHFEP